MTICEYIDSVLKERGMSRRKLAINAGISPSSLQSAFERNTKLSLEMLIPIVKVLNLDWKEIVKCGYDERELKISYSDLSDIASALGVYPHELLSDDMEQMRAGFRELGEEWRKRALINAFDKLNPNGQTIVVDVATGLSTIPKYSNAHKEPPQTAGEPPRTE